MAERNAIAEQIQAAELKRKRALLARQFTQDAQQLVRDLERTTAPPDASLIPARLLGCQQHHCRFQACSSVCRPETRSLMPA